MERERFIKNIALYDYLKGVEALFPLFMKHCAFHDEMDRDLYEKEKERLVALEHASRFVFCPSSSSCFGCKLGCLFDVSPVSSYKLPF